MFGPVAVIVVLLLALAGCSDDSDGSAESPETTTTETSQPVIIDIFEDNGKITPDDAKVVKVGVGQDIQLNVTSDADDVIHVHSDPEQEFEVKAGADQSFTFAIDSPGRYEVESHVLEVVLVKLQVS
jgi:ABC-type tungstate transport system permease subunit